MKRASLAIILSALPAFLGTPLPAAEPLAETVALPAKVRVQVPPGMTVGDAQAVLSPGTLGQRDPAVAFGSGVYLLVWQDGFSGAGGHSEILGMRIDGKGKPVDARPLTIASGGGTHVEPAVAACGGRFFVAWSTFNGKDLDVRGAFVAAEGAFAPTAGLAIADGPGAQFAPAVAADDAGNLLVAWQAFESGRYVMRGTRLSAAGQILDKEPLPLNDIGDRPNVLWTGGQYLLSYRWNRALVGKDGKIRMPMTPAWWSKTPGAGTAAAAWGQAFLFFNTEPFPDPWGWGGNGAVIGVSIAPDGTSPEADLAKPLGNLQSSKATGRVFNCLDAARWRNHDGWPMGFRGGLKGTHNDQWPSGRPTAAYNGRSLLVVWPRAHMVDAMRLCNRDLCLARVLPGWGTVDRTPTCIVGGPTEETAPTLAAGPVGQALLAYERVTDSGVAVEYRLLTEAEDRQPPQVEYVVPKSDTEWIVVFDEPIEAGSVNAEVFRLEGQPLKSAALNPDARGQQREAILVFEKAPPPGRSYALTVDGVKDRSPAGNPVRKQTFEFLAKPGVMQRAPFIENWVLLGPLPRDVKNHPFDVTRIRPSPGDELKLPSGPTLKWQATTRQAIDLGSVFNEDPEQMCYANVYVFSDRARDAVLRVDSNDNNRLWLNGKLVQDGITGVTASRGFHDYADETPVKLQQGWNQVLLQVDNQMTTWMMSGQITDATGECLRDLTYQSVAPAK